MLGERLTLVEAFGGALVLAGLLWLVRVRAGASGGSNSERVPVGYYLIAAAGPLFFGTAFVIRKWGLQRFDSTMIGAFLGAAAAFAVLLLIDIVRGSIRERIAMNLTVIPWWFVAAGVSTSLAMLSQFIALDDLPAWVVGILAATQGIWTIVLSVIFLRGDERIDRALVATMVLVASGVVIIALA